MKKVNSYSFDRGYIVKTSIAILMIKIIISEMVLALIAFSWNFFAFSGGSLIVTSTNTAYLGFIFLAINLVIFIYLFLSWNYNYYIISQGGISLNRGVLFRKTKTVDIPGIRSINVRQGLFGKIFNYGTLTLESPLLSENFFMKNLPNPFRHASLIEKARLEVINKEGAENVIINPNS